jgi:hypothetical protein
MTDEHRWNIIGASSFICIYSSNVQTCRFDRILPSMPVDAPGRLDGAGAPHDF